MSTSPQHLGKYELQQRLGWGGMAEVWKAFDPQLQRYVAIKLLHMNLQADPDFVARFQREAQLIASLHHPNIVQIHDFQIAGPPETDIPIAYMVMDYVEGPTLADYIRNTSARGQIPSPADIVNFFTSISLAIDYAHQKGMIHRDIKPANILLDQHNTRFNSMGEPILTDFGVAKLLGISSGTMSGTQLGTPLYISPEQAQGLPGDARSDLYSLGVILYEMVTGVTPFQGNTPVDVLTQHISAVPPSPVLINPRIPPALTSVISQSLAKDPNARFPNATAMTIALAHALNLPVPERLGSLTGTHNKSGHHDESGGYDPANISTFSSPLPPGQQSSGRIPAVSTSGGSTFADSSQNLPIGPTPPRGRDQSGPYESQPYPVVTSGGQVSTGQVQSPTPAPYSGGAASAQSAPTPSAPPFILPPPSAPGRRFSRWYIAFAVLLLVVLIGAGLGGYLVFFNHSNTAGNVLPPNAIVGHAFYVSSGQLADGAQGIADQLQVDMQNVQPPPTGKSYYLWLLADKDTTPKPDFLVPPPIHPPILLTNNLPVGPGGTVHYIYLGDAQHNNLLSETSRLLITREDAGRTPASPSTDRSTWIYYAQLPQEYIPKDPTGLRGLDHIRHIYYNEDHLKVKALYGGLDIWIFRNTAKLLEWSTAARDDFNGTTTSYGQMHNLFTSILDYLDGTPNVHLDVSPGTPVTADLNIASISLLTVDPPRQMKDLANDPPGDLDHLILHLTELNRAPDVTPDILKHSQNILVAISNAEGRLMQARTDAKQLFDMTPAQLAQSTAIPLLDDLVTQVTYAYIGQLDPNTNTVKTGVLQAHYEAQQLATFDITRNMPQSL
jgi:serine/threonine protein kinase